MEHNIKKIIYLFFSSILNWKFFDKYFFFFFFLLFSLFSFHLFQTRYCNDLASSSLLVHELESVGFRLREVKDTTQEWKQLVITRVEEWKKKILETTESLGEGK